MVSNSRKILVVDDEPKIVDVVRSYLEMAPACVSGRSHAGVGAPDAL